MAEGSVIASAGPRAPPRRIGNCTRGSSVCLSPASEASSALIRLPRSGAARAIGLALASLGASACASIPKGAASVDAIAVDGNQAIDGGDIEGRLATAPSPKFLGLFRGVVYDYALLDRSVLQRDLERVARYYRARGYYEAKVRAGRIRAKNQEHVTITIEVEEGAPVLVHDAAISGIVGLDEGDAKAVRAALTALVKPGAPFEEAPYVKAEAEMIRALTTRGYAWARVTRSAFVDLPAHQATLTYAAQLGPKATFGAITLDGLGELPEGPVLRAIDLAPGAPYSTRSLETAQQAVLDLGTFSSAEIVPVLPDPPPADARVPLRVHVQVQKLKSLILGGGLELDAIRAQAHLRVGWEHRSFLGGFRHFTIELKPGLDLFPTRLPSLQAPTAVLLEERFRVELRQPGFLEARTNGVIRSELNAYPLLLTTTVDPQAPVLGYLEYKGSVGLDRLLWKLFASPTYSFQWNNPFAYRGTRDADLRPLVVSALDALAHLDLRDDRIRPHRGLYAQADLQFAGLGGDARDLRILSEARAYLPFGKKVTLAARATVGFLFPFNYGDAPRAAIDSKPGDPGRAESIRDIELVYLRGFFSGGPSSNRGYPLRAVGPRGAVPFLASGVGATTTRCDPGSGAPGDASCAVPLGGLTLWESSLELRFPLVGAFSGSTFCDASDASPARVNLRFTYPHLSCGVGLRYDTPIGPVRLDVGYRIPGVQVPVAEAAAVEAAAGSFFGVPLAFAFGIGEAF
jgi:outer membrane protein insertion porin family/translocation and assembly module TamA